MVPDKEGAAVSSFFPNEKIEEVVLLDGGANGDNFALSAGLVDALPNANAPGWALPNTTGDPAGVVENVLLDAALPNTLLGVDVDVLASPLGCGALDFSKILLETPFAFAPKPEPPKTAAVEAPALLPSSLVAFAAPKIDNGTSVFFASPPDEGDVAKADIPDGAPKLGVDLGADEAPVKPDAGPPENGPNKNLGVSDSAPLGLCASEVSAGFDAAVALPPEPNTDVDVGWLNGNFCGGLDPMVLDWGVAAENVNKGLACFAASAAVAVGGDVAAGLGIVLAGFLPKSNFSGAGAD